MNSIFSQHFDVFKSIKREKYLVPEMRLQISGDRLPLTHGVKNAVDVGDHHTVSSRPAAAVSGIFSPPVPIPVFGAPAVSMR